MQFARARRKKYTFPMRYYSSHAKALYEKYRRLDAEALHESWLAHLPESPGLACDAAMPQSRQPLSWNAPHEGAFFRWPGSRYKFSMRQNKTCAIRGNGADWPGLANGETNNMKKALAWVGRHYILTGLLAAFVIYSVAADARNRRPYSHPPYHPPHPLSWDSQPSPQLRDRLARIVEKDRGFVEAAIKYMDYEDLARSVLFLFDFSNTYKLIGNHWVASYIDAKDWARLAPGLGYLNPTNVARTRHALEIAARKHIDPEELERVKKKYGLGRGGEAIAIEHIGAETLARVIAENARTQWAKAVLRELQGR